MRRRLLVFLFTCGCGASASPSPPPPVVTIPTAAPAATATAAPSPSALARELEQLDTAVVATLGSRPAQPGDVPIGRLGGAPSSGTAGLNLGGGGGGLIQPGAADGGLAAIGDGKVKGPVGKAAVGSPSVKGTIVNASAVVAGMTGGFRRCFSRGLMDDPSMKGSVVITASIGPQGEVLSASPSGGNGLSSNVIACAAARVSAAHFAPPDGGSATVSIPVTFSTDAP